jgi:CRP/FNR family cyclic AMP-dependent transcriptional regulator
MIDTGSVVSRAHLEPDPCRDERPRACVSEPEAPRDVTNGFGGGFPAADGAKDLGHDALDTRRHVRLKREDDVDVRRRCPAPAPPHVTIDLGTQAAVPCRHLLLRLTRPAVGAVRHRICVTCPRLDPVRSLGSSNHGGTSRAASIRGNERAEGEPCRFATLRDVQQGLTRWLTGQLTTRAGGRRGLRYHPALWREPMACDPSVFEGIPIFSLLDADERAVLADQVELRRFSARQRIYRAGDPGEKAYVVLNGKVQVVVIDEDNQEVVIDTPQDGEIFGLSSMLSASTHQTTATALEPTAAIEIDRHDIAALLQRKPMAGLDMLTMVGRHFRAAQDLVRARAARNPNEVIEENLTFGDHLADSVARFGGSWSFIIAFGVVLAVWVVVNLLLYTKAFDPFPFILLNLFLSMLAAIQAPIIMMSQNRQDAKDRLRSELDFAVNRKAETEIIQLAAKLNRLEDRLDDLHDGLSRSGR